MGSIKLITVRGIPIRMHITFPLILIMAAFVFGQRQIDWLDGALFGVVATILLFVGVVLHELAHSLMARQFGVQVKEITLLPLGGVAQMSRIPERPYQELLIALAGPVTSGLLGWLLFVVARQVLPDYVRWEFRNLFLSIGNLQWRHMLYYLSLVNLFLAVFNLVPAFPMDGGRVMRALLAMLIPYGRATRIAVSTGRWLSLLIGLMGLFLGGDILLILVAFFVYQGATEEGRLARVRAALTGVQVRQAFSRLVQAVHPDDSLEKVTALVLEGFQNDFPVCEEERLVGLLTSTDLLVGLQKSGPLAQVRQAMQEAFDTVKLDDDLFEVQQRMGQNQLDAMPVMEGERVLGLLTHHDLDKVFQLVSVRPGILRSKVS